MIGLFGTITDEVTSSLGQFFLSLLNYTSFYNHPCIHFNRGIYFFITL